MTTSDLLDRLQAALGTTYRLEKELGGALTEALDLLEAIGKKPSVLNSPDLIRVDRECVRLRVNPRFERLVTQQTPIP